MNLSTTSTSTGSAAFRSLHTLLFVVSMLTFNLNSANAWAENLRPDDIRVLGSTQKFDNTWQYAAVFKLRPPRRLRANHLELAVGVITSTNNARPYVSLGPVWRFAFGRYSSAFIDLGISPTLVSGSSFDGRRMGGSFYFTSSVSVGKAFGTRQRTAVSVRVQHTSNGGLENTNPGLDMIGLNFSYDFGGGRS